MGFLNHYIASKNIKAAGEDISNLPKVNPQQVTQEVDFPTDPSKVYLKEAPKGFSPVTKEEESPRLENIDQELADKAMKMGELAKKLREYKEQQLKQLYNDYKRAEEEFKKSVNYNEQLVELETLVKSVGTNVLELMAQMGDTSFALYKVQNMFLLISRELKESIGPVTDLDKFEALKNVIYSKLDKNEADRIVMESEAAAEQMRTLVITMNKKMNIFPISEEYRKQGQSEDITLMLNYMNQTVVNLLKRLYEFDTEAEDVIYDLEGILGSTNVVQMPPYQNEMGLAAWKTQKET